MSGADAAEETRPAPSALALLRPSRRELLKTGVAGAFLLALAALAAPTRARAAEAAAKGDDAFAFLNPADRAIVAAIAPVLLDGALPEASRAAAVGEVVAGVDRAISGLTPAARAELRQLFDLLDLGLARIVVAGLWRPWQEAAPEDIAEALQGWRESRFALLRSAYLALHELTFAAWYGNPRSWPRIGYPGPPEIG